MQGFRNTDAFVYIKYLSDFTNNNTITITAFALILIFNVRILKKGPLK